MGDYLIGGIELYLVLKTVQLVYWINRGVNVNATVNPVDDVAHPQRHQDIRDVKEWSNKKGSPYYYNVNGRSGDNMDSYARLSAPEDMKRYAQRNKPALAPSIDNSAIHDDTPLPGSDRFRIGYVDTPELLDVFFRGPYDTKKITYDQTPKNI